MTGEILLTSAGFMVLGERAVRVFKGDNRARAMVKFLLDCFLSLGFGSVGYFIGGVAGGIAGLIAGIYTSYRIGF